MDVGATISKSGKLLFAELISAYQPIESILEKTHTDGPYRVETITECKDYLATRKKSTSRIPHWRTINIVTLSAAWFCRNDSVTPPKYQTNVKVSPLSSEELHDEKAISVAQNCKGGLEKASQEAYGGARAHNRALLKKEICLILVCVIIAVVYSATTQDVQTGLQLRE